MILPLLTLQTKVTKSPKDKFTFECSTRKNLQANPIAQK